MYGFLRLTHIMASILFVVKRQTVQTQIRRRKTASDQGLQCLLIDCPIRVGITMKNNTQQPLKRKWTGPINNSGKFHSA